VTAGRKYLTRGPYVGQQWFKCFDGSISVLKYIAATFPIYDQIPRYLYEQSPTWEAYSSSATQQIPRTEWNPTHAKKNYTVFDDSGIAHSVYCYGYMLQDRGAGVRLPARATNLSLFLNDQAGTGTHSASCPTDIGSCSPWQGGRSDTDHSIVPRGQVKYVCS